MTHPQIAAFARLAKENTAPVRVINGQKTRISRTMHGLAYDDVHDEIVVPSPLAQAVLIFRGGAEGEEPPLRVIQGPHTGIVGTGYGALDTVSVDGENNEIYLPVASDHVLVFDRMASGDVAPKRMLGGPDTQIRYPVPADNGPLPPVAIDTVHNLLVVKSTWPRGTTPSFLIFDRTASGNTKPLRVIQGPKAAIGGGNQIQVYAPKGWIIGGATGPGPSVGIWSVNDNGDVPPHWRIPVNKLTGLNVNGVGIDPMHKEVMVPTGNGNVVMTFFFPEMFE